MKYVQLIVAVLAVALGIAALAFGEADDSPGLQLMGALLVAGTVGVAARVALRTR